MFELADARPGMSVQESEYLRLLGYPRNFTLEGRPRELVEWARQWYQKNGRPWVYARQVNEVRLGSDGLSIEGTLFSSKRLASQFIEASADGAFVVAVSAGEECEEMARQLWLDEKPDEYFFLEMFGSAVVEHLVMTTGFRFCEWADRLRVAILPHYSPGYPGWDIADQQSLKDVILQGGRNVFPGKLRVLETGMLNPKKSLLAVFGITSRVEQVKHLSNLIPCENCSLDTCQYRRSPYRRALPQLEHVKKLSALDIDEAVNNEIRQRRAPDSKYTISPQALRKWSLERLQLNRLQNGSIEAQFRYEGTTCSNLGRPLEFLYNVTLGPPESGYRINEARCTPSPSDDGYRYMCDYIEKGDTFIKSIAEEKPLRGKPLDDVLTWERQYSPSGCFCDSAGRQNKWGLVFEVLHYALSHGINGVKTEVTEVKNSEAR